MTLKPILTVALVMAMAVSCAQKGPVETKLPRGASPCDTTHIDSVFMDVWSNACDELHALMVVKDGKVIYERYANGHKPNDLHIMWSASKTFTATAVGFARQDGLLKTDDKILQYFTPEEIPAEPSEWLQKMTIHDLLTMSGGFKDDYIGPGAGGQDFDWAQKTLASEIVFEPGTRFAYNSMETYLLSVIVSRVTGKKVVDYLNEKLFTPLGIVNYIWEESPQGYNSGGWGLYLTLESFAKMGQFMLQRGEWNGVQLLDKEWFDEAMSPQIMQYAGENPDEATLKSYETNEWTQGYGYQMWCCTHGAYRLDGAHSQMSIIVPDKNLVVTFFAYSPNAGGIIDSVWKRIYNNL